MSRKHFTTRTITRAAIIAALYTALSLLLAPISFGFNGMQLRIAEALTLLPVLLPEAIPGLFIGCLLTNLLGGAALPDIILGSLTTLAAAYLTYRLAKNRWAAALPPVVLNALIVGPMVHLLYTPEIPLLLCVAYVGLGQAVACYVLGLPLLAAVERLPERALKG